MIDKIKELASKKFDSFEIVEIKTASTPVSYSAGKLKSVNTTEKHGFALRAIKDGKIAFSSTTKPNDAEALVEQTLAAIPYSPKAEIEFTGEAGTLPNPAIEDDKIKKLETEKMIEMGGTLIEKLSPLHEKAKTGAGVSKDSSSMRIVTSNGFDKSYSKDEMGIYAGINLVDGDNMLSAWDVYTGCKYDDDTTKIIANITKFFGWGLKNVPVKSGKYKVLFTPSAVGDIIGILKASWMGTSVYKGVSPWKDKVGQKIADEKLSIYDDGTIDWLEVSSPFDCEGTPAQKTAIIENGVLKSFIADKVTASRLGISPTGNGFKRGGGFDSSNNIDATPITASSNNIITPGNKKSEDILAGMDEGILVDSLLGTMMGNPLSGMLSGNIGLGFHVKDGKVLGRVKDAMLTFNLFTAIQDSILEISSDAEGITSWAGNCLNPWMLFDNGVLATK
ncbi:MAG: TldD/PmbA family protein [Caldisericia bacterium]